MNTSESALVTAVQATLVADDGYNRHLSRKFLLAIFSVLCAFILVAMDRVDGSLFSTVAVAALAGYFTANVAQKKLVEAPEAVSQ